MEGAETGVVTASGMAAVSAVLLGLLKAGDHIVAGNQLYGRCLRLLTRELPRLGFEATLVDASNAQAVAAALRSEEHTSELQSLMRISYAVFCLKKKKKQP